MQRAGARRGRPGSRSLQFGSSIIPSCVSISVAARGCKDRKPSVRAWVSGSGEAVPLWESGQSPRLAFPPAPVRRRSRLSSKWAGCPRQPVPRRFLQATRDPVEGSQARLSDRIRSPASRSVPSAGVGCEGGRPWWGPARQSVSFPSRLAQIPWRGEGPVGAPSVHPAATAGCGGPRAARLSAPPGSIIPVVSLVA